MPLQVKIKKSKDLEKLDKVSILGSAIFEDKESGDVTLSYFQSKVDD